MDHTKINLLVKLQHLDNQIESIVSLQKGLPEENIALDEDLTFTSRQIESRKKIADDNLKLRQRLHETIHECKNKILNFAGSSPTQQAEYLYPDQGQVIYA